MTASESSRPLVGPLDADRVRPGTLRPHLARSAAFATAMAVFVVIWLIGLTLSTLSALSMIGVKTAVDLGPSLDSGLSVVGLGGMGLVGIGWLVALMVPVREFVAGGAVMLPDAADSAEVVRDGIAASLRRRCPPFELSDDEVGDGPALLLRNRREYALVAGQPVGPDLQVVWTMWRNRTTLSLIGTVLSDMLDGPRAGDTQLLEIGSSSAMTAALETAVTDASTRAGRAGAG